jgi:predicted dehydrogenase
MTERLRGVCVGAGYFSRFHFEAWKRIPDVEIVSVCDLDAEKAARSAEEHGIPTHHVQLARALDELSPDFVDIITPPATHLPLVREIAPRRLPIICQKPLAPSLEEARKLVEAAESHGTRLMVHENFRFQPWYRAIRRLIDDGAVGDRLHSLTFRMRMGDGWGEDAYLRRQPYFREMPRLLVYETGVHFIDTLRFLAGEIDGVYAVLRRLNPVIQGEDAGLVVFEFTSGAVGVWDANRYNECNDPDPRFTFGELLVEGSGGSIRLYLDGRLTVQPLGEQESEHEYERERRGFAGDCVYFTQKHFAGSLRSDKPFETSGLDYLRTLAVQEAVYRSARERRPVRGMAHHES